MNSTSKSSKLIIFLIFVYFVCSSCGLHLLYRNWPNERSNFLRQRLLMAPGSGRQLRDTAESLKLTCGHALSVRINRLCKCLKGQTPVTKRGSFSDIPPKPVALCCHELCTDSDIVQNYCSKC